MEYKLELPQYSSAALVYHLGQAKMEISDFCLSLVSYNSSDVTCAYPSVGSFFPLCIWSNNSVCQVYRPKLGTAQEAVLWPELLSSLSSLPGTPTTVPKN